jgi:predicted restriction endonuclease
VSLNPDEEESVAAGSQSRLRLIEERAGQRPFREAIMKRDGGKCTITGCRVIQALEAAHLIPYASDHQHRDNPANGILLRADIHLLFDRYLMAINPETMRI